MRKVYCDYCGRQAEYVDSKVVYGKSYGMMYLCRNCTFQRELDRSVLFFIFKY